MPTNMPLDIRPDKAATPSEVIPASPATLPAVVASDDRRARRRRLGRSLFAVALLMVAAGGIGTWWLRSGSALPPGIAWGNGRLEADQIDIDTKFAGRIAKLLVDEGDMVAPGQVVA